ncbi:Zinc Finger Protein Castor-like 1 [Manis pentadactyla]|nr:Zinc Finger Protein Castor-like 1 [Manis pentadactyla]
MENIAYPFHVKRHLKINDLIQERKCLGQLQRVCINRFQVMDRSLHFDRLFVYSDLWPFQKRERTASRREPGPQQMQLLSGCHT